MADIKLFTISPRGVTELAATSVTLEKGLQTLIEQNMQTFFGATFLRSEYSITNGRIDSLGLDENNCPVIFEYKRSINENVINQGLFYLDWLLDHKADFKLLVMEQLGKEKADNIDWTMPCVICIANNFTKFDEHAVNQMQRNIKLVRYKKFGENLVLFEHLNVPTIKPIMDVNNIGSDVTDVGSGKESSVKTFLQQFAEAPAAIKSIYETIRDYILSLGDDVTENQLKYYVAFKKIKNIICAEIYPNKIVLHLRLNPDEVELQDGFIKDMRNIGHWGTGDLQIVIKSVEDFGEARELIDRAYNEN
jgi:predicted transport protein